MRDKRSVAQVQLGEEVVDLKTQLLSMRQLLGAMARLNERLLGVLEQRGLLENGDPVVTQYREILDEVKRSGLNLSAPPATLEHVQCPGCGARLSHEPGQSISRCQWCGYEFTGS